MIKVRGVISMFRFLRITDGWRLAWQGIGGRRRAKGSMAAGGQRFRRNQSRRRPVIESVEARVLLSSFAVRSAGAATSAEIFRAKKSPVQLTAVSGFGVKGGQAFLAATLTSGGSACRKDDSFSGQRASGRHRSDRCRRRCHALPRQHAKCERGGLRARSRRRIRRRFHSQVFDRSWKTVGQPVPGNH